MTRKLYWALGALILLVGAFSYVIYQEYADIQKIKKDGEAFSEEIANMGKQPDTRGHTDASIPRPPPLGETPDTGYWEGDTWHVKPAPKPKKSWFWSEDPDKLAYRMTYGHNINYSERVLLARHIVREYPYSEAAIEARYKLIDYDENGNDRLLGSEARIPHIKNMLKYHPNSPRVLTDLAMSLDLDSPEEAIAFAQKSLRIDPANNTTHNALATAYQRLGDYKTALFHLKAGQKLSDPEELGWVEIVIDEHTSLYNDYDRFTYEISMIEAGTPRYGPDPQPMSPSADVPLFPSDAVFTPDPDPDPPFDVPFDMLVPLSVDERVVDVDVPSVREEAAVRAREAVETARGDADQQRQQEFESFLRWMEQIEQAKSPADLNGFLMRELAMQLQGDVSEFTPARLLRAYETLYRQGETAGMRELEKLDAALAREMLRHPPKKRVPPRPQRTPPNRKK